MTKTVKNPKNMWLFQPPIDRSAVAKSPDIAFHADLLEVQRPGPDSWDEKSYAIQKFQQISMIPKK